MLPFRTKTLIGGASKIFTVYMKTLFFSSMKALYNCIHFDKISTEFFFNEKGKFFHCMFFSFVYTNVLKHLTADTTLTCRNK